MGKNNINSTFINSLKNNNLDTLKKMPKSDLHNHATRGGNIRYLIPDYENSNYAPPVKFNDLSQMQEWYEGVIKPYFNGKEGFVKRIKGSFLQAKKDGVKKLVLGFGIDDMKFFNNINEYVDFMKNLKDEIFPNINFIPEICLVRTNKIKELEKLLDEILSFNFFRSIDLVGNPNIEVIKFKDIYKKAKEKGLRLRAHVGEFSNAKSIKEAVDILNLDEVQHGINAVNSIEVMNYLADRKIQLNICPTSNVMLNRVDAYKNHPISKLYRHGIPVTINSDDMLIFDQSVSEEYLNLYNSGNLTAEELDEIRLIGLGKHKMS